MDIVEKLRIESKEWEIEKADNERIEASNEIVRLRLELGYLIDDIKKMDEYKLKIIALETENTKLMDKDSRMYKTIVELMETDQSHRRAAQEAVRLLQVENEKLLNKIKILEVALDKFIAKGTANSIADDILNGNGNTGGIDFSDFSKKREK
jgi:hypothetical protein